MMPENNMTEQGQVKYREVTRKSGITKTDEFRKKKLCTHSLDIGVVCDHGCLYCSTPTIASARTHPAFPEDGTTAQEAHNAGIAYVDLGTPENVKQDAKGLTILDTVMICTKVDPYSPAVQELNLFRDSLKNLLEANSVCKVRVLSKNAGIVDVLEDFTDYKDRIAFSLSITAPPDLQEFVDIVEPRTSSIRDRLDAIKRAKEMGFNVYGMICPCCPGILSLPDQLEAVLNELIPLSPEAVWLEPVNSRGQGFTNMVETLRDAGKTKWAEYIEGIKDSKRHEVYTSSLINAIHDVHAKLAPKIPFHILTYNPQNLLKGMVKDDTDVVWLNKEFRHMEIMNVYVDELVKDDDQPRKFFDNDALASLKESIIQYGLMQPIVFRVDEKKKQVIVAGERRVRAIKSIIREAKKNPDDPASQELLKRFEQIKGVFVSDNHKEIALIENVQRENLNPVELAEGLAKLKEEGGYDQNGLGTLIGKSAPTVSEILSINKIPDEIRDEARKSKNVSQWVLVEVAKAKGPKAKAKKWDQLKDSGLSQSAFRKKKKKSVEKDKSTGQSFNFGSSIRAVKTASTQIQKLKGVDMGGIDADKQQKLRSQLETLRDELEQVLAGLKTE